MFLTIAFYHFVSLENIKQFQPFIQKFCQKNNIKGTILLASEGINGTISGQDISIHNFLRFIRDDSFFNDNFKNLEHKESWAEKNPFYRMKVRLKKEIVALGVDGISPTKKVGKYVTPEEWNNLIKDPNTIVIDTRNNYEVDIGTFKNSINPKTKSFREFPKYIEKQQIKKDQPIAMFCTGGIRCEKASSYLLQNGYKNVCQLDGGIINYLEFKKNKKKSSWTGECFVFDNRVSINNKLQKGVYDQCFGCRNPISEYDKKLKSYRKGVSCRYCISKRNKKQINSSITRQKQIEVAERKGEKHQFSNIYIA